MAKKTNNQCVVFDFTLSESYCTNHKDLIKTLKPWCKKYCFQLEKGDTGYIHYQGRVSLLKKRRQCELRKVMKDVDTLKHARWSVTSNGGKGDLFYILKADTKLSGPWADTDPYIPRQVREMKDLRPFQRTIIESADVWDTRHINVVYCPKGNIGKSRLTAYMRAHQLGRALPPINDYKELMGVILCVPVSKLYIIDMPRAMKKDKLGGFYSAIESLKDGYAYDTRYTFKEKNFDCPQVWIFSNNLPDFNLLSRDRWIIYEVNEKYALVKRANSI